MPPDRAAPGPPPRVGPLIDWLFRDRTTGRITVVQFPNAPLWIFIVASLVRRLVNPAGTFDATLRIIITGSLFWWAADEIVRGVNPWRRFLGGAVLAGQLVGLATRVTTP